MDDQLTQKEAELALSIIMQSGASIRFNADNPDEAIEAANVYKSLVAKLKMMTRLIASNGQMAEKAKA